MKCGEFLDQLRTGEFLKKDSAPWSLAADAIRLAKYSPDIITTSEGSLVKKLDLV